MKEICAQVTVPRYKKYSSKGKEPTTLIAFNMVCHGLSQNANNHQLNSYRDVIVGKPYSKICDNISPTKKTENLSFAAMFFLN